MAEIVFPCQCGLLLKVHGDDQVGQGIVCPSCGSTVVVPAAGIVVDEPAPLVASRRDLPRPPRDRRVSGLAWPTWAASAL